MDKKKSAPKTKVDGVKMSLSVLDRVLVPMLLLKKGSMADLETAEDIKKKTEIGKKEEAEIKLKRSQAGITWDDAAKDKVFTFSRAEIRCLKRSYEIADEAGEIISDMLNLCRKVKKVEL